MIHMIVIYKIVIQRAFVKEKLRKIKDSASNIQLRGMRARISVG